MPKLTRTVPRYRKHRTSGQAVVELNGKTIYLGPHGTKASKVEYDRIIAEWLAHDRRLSSPADATGTTITELCVAYYISNVQLGRCHCGAERAILTWNE